MLKLAATTILRDKAHSIGHHNDTLHVYGLQPGAENFNHRNQKQRQQQWQQACKSLVGVNGDDTKVQLARMTAESIKRLSACKCNSNGAETFLQHLHESALGHSSTSDSAATELLLDCAPVCHSCSSLDSLKWCQKQQQQQHQQQKRQLERCNPLQSHADDQLDFVPLARADAVGKLASALPSCSNSASASSHPDHSPSRHTRQSTVLASAESGTKNEKKKTATRNAAKVRPKPHLSSIFVATNWQTYAFALFVSFIIFSSFQTSRSPILTSAKSIESSPTKSPTKLDKPAKLPIENQLQLQEGSELEISASTGPSPSPRSTPDTETSNTATSTPSPSEKTTKFDDLIGGLSSLSSSTPAKLDGTTTTSASTTATSSTSNETEIATSPATIAISTTTSAIGNNIEERVPRSSASIVESESIVASTESVTESPRDESTGAGSDDNDAEDCEGLSSDESEEGTKLTDNERLVNLQACLQKKVKTKLTAMSRGGMTLFDELSLSGGCSSSLMTLMYAMGELKSYAFKFLDASAKIPSGVMYGLLSDFGDFDECLSIRSNPLVQPADEVDEGTFSGKYCLLTIKLNYHVQLAPNSSVPDGIYPDGILWDELIRSYWTSNTTKGFQVGVCVPSRCSSDDIAQLYQLTAKNYNFRGEVTTCQDSNDVRRQQTPDTVQLVIIYTFSALLVLSVVAALIDRYQFCNFDQTTKQSQSIEFVVQIIICFSIRCNWRLFLEKNSANHCSVSGPLRVATGGSSGVSLAPGGRMAPPLRNCVNSFQSDLTQFTVASGSSVSAEECNQQTNADVSSVVSSAVRDATTKRSVSASELNGQSHQFSSGPQPQQQPSSVSVNSAQESNKLLGDYGQLSVDIAPREQVAVGANCGSEPAVKNKYHCSSRSSSSVVYSNCDTTSGQQLAAAGQGDILSHLSGLKLLVIVWITVGHSFLYPSANNYQHYRSIINMNITRDSVWFAATNFTLGIDMLLYMIGLIFVYKLANNNTSTSGGNSYRKQKKKQQQQKKNQEVTPRLKEIFLSNQPEPMVASCASSKSSDSAIDPSSLGIVWLILRKILRLWPTYLAVISLAIVVPLVSDGPMWPEMVSQRLGDACRSNWWANLLMANNFGSATDICLPSSWFVSVIMQCFLVGSIIAILARKRSLNVAISILVLVLLGSILISFVYAYQLSVSAPAIRMDESFVLEIDDSIYRLYTSIFNNLGPFLVGMLGGIVLIKWRIKNDKRHLLALIDEQRRARSVPTTKKRSSSGNKEDKVANKIDKLTKIVCNFNVLFAISLLAVLVLSSVFNQHYTKFWASVYWSCHRTGWAIVTGYLVHQCATGKWKLLRDLLSLSSFIPLSKLIFIVYLVYPIFIHMHSGLVRDGLHVTIYNMMNIYITRIVMTIVTALAVYLLVELPFCSIEEILLKKWLLNKRQTISASSGTDGGDKTAVAHPLLVVAPTVCLNQCHNKVPAEVQQTESTRNKHLLKDPKAAGQRGTARDSDISLAQSSAKRQAPKEEI